MSALRISSSQVVAIAGRQRDADAGADHDLDAVDVVTGAQDLDQPGGEFAGLVRRDVGGQDDRKLVAAEPGHQIVAAQPATAAGRPPAATAGRPSGGRMNR